MPSFQQETHPLFALIQTTTNITLILFSIVILLLVGIIYIFGLSSVYERCVVDIHVSSTYILGYDSFTRNDVYQFSFDKHILNEWTLFYIQRIK